MEPRHVSGKNHWYHETQSRTQHSDVMPLVPEAAYVDDRFLLDLTLHDIIIINQVVGFVGFQARVIALLQAHLGFPVRWIPGMPVQEDADAALFSHDSVQWHTDLHGIESHQTNTPQGEALHRWQSIPELEALAPVLAHEEELLNGLGELIDALTFAHPLQPLSSLIPARINGSVSCFNYYSSQWLGASGLPEAVRNGERALHAWSHHFPCERAVAQATQLLTRAPDRFSAAQLAPLLEHGLSTPDAITLLAWSALSGWLNRLRIALGCGQQVT